jgi:3-hydroxybutyryl-CoA dehydrogenase
MIMPTARCLELDDMTIRTVHIGDSRSFPDGLGVAEGDGCIVIGDLASAPRGVALEHGEQFVALELNTECLANHIGLDETPAHQRTVGFARFRMGDAEPSGLIELVHMPWTASAAIDAARAVFEAMGFTVAVCGDFPGRIVNRLIRPYLNAVLRRLDDGLASAGDMDTTLRLGLGYPEGPNALLARTGLAAHFDVSQALYEALGDPDFSPPRRARIAKVRGAQ